jgi:hypothetical protein
MTPDTPPRPEGDDPPIIAEPDAPDYTSCNRQTRAFRVSKCNVCVNRTNEEITRCSITQLDINLMISATQLTCPEGYW